MRTPAELWERYEALRAVYFETPGATATDLLAALVAEEVDAERAECIDDARCESLCCGCSQRIVERIQARSALKGGAK